MVGKVTRVEHPPRVSATNLAEEERRLPTQRECRRMLCCEGDGKARKFAEIVACTVLCGELGM